MKLKSTKVCLKINVRRSHGSKNVRIELIIDRVISTDFNSKNTRRDIAREIFK